MKTYTVQPGDTLSVLATVLIGPGASYQDLWQYNAQIANPDYIQVGDVIFYPESASSSPSILASSKFAFLKKPAFLYSISGLLLASAFLIRPGMKKANPAVSKKQASLFGIAAKKGPFVIKKGPNKGELFDVTKKQAREYLRGTKVKKLPLRKKKRKR